MYEQQFLQKRNTFSHPQFMCFDYCWGPQYHLSIIVPKQPSIRRSADPSIHRSSIIKKMKSINELWTMEQKLSLSKDSNPPIGIPNIEMLTDHISVGAA